MAPSRFESKKGVEFRNVRAKRISVRDIRVGLDEDGVRSLLREELRENAARIAGERGVSPASLQAVLLKLGEAGIPDHLLPGRLDAAANELVDLRAELARLRNGRSEFAAVRETAIALLDEGVLDAARAMLGRGREMAHALREETNRTEAEFLADEARIDHLQLAYLAAADKYGEAASLVQSFDHAEGWNYLLRQASELSSHGREFGGTTSLTEAIEVYHRALVLAPREWAPLDWASTQNGLGVVLHRLGAREGGTGYLEEAVAAFRSALEERTRGRAPLDWAETQNNLGRSLRSLGARRRNRTENLEKAVTAFRAALEERTRDRVPLDWAETQNSLGNVLRTLGAREDGTELLEEAVTAFRAALEERTRDRVPLDWAETQNSLGNALLRLGARDNESGKLEEALTAFRWALEERTRDRAPIAWALTQMNLGRVLQLLGERESGTMRLEAAVANLLTAFDTLGAVSPNYLARICARHLKRTRALLSARNN